MFRLLIQFLISQKIDDRRPLGAVLSWFIRHDPAIRRFHDNLWRLDIRLRDDAAALLECSATNQKTLPLMKMRRTIAFSSRDTMIRKKSRRHSMAMALLVVFILTVGIGILTFFSKEGRAVMASSHAIAIERLDSAMLQNDPAAMNEVLRLCRDSSDESVSFFQSPVIVAP